MGLDFLLLVVFFFVFRIFFFLIFFFNELILCRPCLFFFLKRPFPLVFDERLVGAFFFSSFYTFFKGMWSSLLCMDSLNSDMALSCSAATGDTC